MKRKKLVGSIFTIAGTLAVIYVVTGFLLFLVQDKILFLPSSDIRATPGNAGMEYEEHFFPSSNGYILHGWFVPANSGEDAITILFSHGNAGNISGRVNLISLYRNLGFNVFIYDYQGYGLSEGRPSEENILQDGLAAWDFLVDEIGLIPDKILPVGRSMGGPVAAFIASERNASALVIESTFTNVPDVARHTYYIYPVDLLARIHLPTIDFVSSFEGPVMVAHSREDRLIPYELGRQLYYAAGSERVWLELSGGHNEGYIATGAAYTEAYTSFISTVFPQASDGEI
ncbi:MAG: alpha/beta hydrolase [Balneolia bacterium]|nr:alpha/beta hydrolase [Balneolia bacterium]